MKRNQIFLVGLLVLGFVVFSSLAVKPAMAAGTMGEVINASAACFKMPAADLIAILYSGGFDGAAPATEERLALLCASVNAAYATGKITGNCSTCVANAAKEAGVSEDIIKAGLTTGMALSAAAGTRGGGAGSGGTSGPGGSGGGGGGGAVSPSR